MLKLFVILFVIKLYARINIFKSAFALTIVAGTSLLCAAFFVSRDTISLKMVSDETRSNENEK